MTIMFDWVLKTQFFAQKISAEPLSLLKPNLVWACIIMNQSVMQKK